MVLDCYCTSVPALEKAPAVRNQHGNRPDPVRHVWKYSPETPGGTIPTMLDQHGD
jgi:hypothetical protein